MREAGQYGKSPHMTTEDFSKTVKQVRRLIPAALRADRHYARQRIDFIYKRGSHLPSERVNRILADVSTRLEKSAVIKKMRIDSFPPVSINPDLPIAARQAEIIAAVKAHPVVIVSGATGSGKTTQIPKMCVAAGLGRDGRIGCTQPRRIAALTIARRISTELGTASGTAVGYKIRFSDRTADKTLVKIMTDGILLSEAHHDPLLNEYDVLVIDEAHERSLNIDFILGLLKTILAKRADLKVVITSATIDTRKFSAAFSDAPVIEVSGTLYPVTVEHIAPETGKTGPAGDGAPDAYVDQAASAVDGVMRKTATGDILVFMPTARDIRDLCRILTGRKYPAATVLPLYAQLPANRQESVFKRHRGRKIIVATNIAETSLTVPGVQYVVDTGLARIPYYNPRTRVTSLAVRKISQSSALQRQGRCGRVSDGVCIRLYSEKDFARRQVYTPPEILRANLAEVILRMMALKLGDVRDFPFVDPPMEKSIVDGFEVLYELGAIVSTRSRETSSRMRYRLTKTGTLMAKIPVDPRLARIMIEAGRAGCLEAALVIAAALSIQDPREQPPEKEKEARAAQTEYIDPASDFMTLLNLWEAIGGKEAGTLKTFCRNCFLSPNRVSEWRDIYFQLRDIAAEYRLAQPSNRRVDRNKEPDRFYEVFHKALLSGYLANIAEKKEKNVYLAGKSREVMIFPGSALSGKEADWIVSAELVETARLYARTAAVVKRKWIKETAGDLCRLVYINSRWSRERGEAVADRQSILFGLCVDIEAGVPYGADNPREAGDVFVRQALVRGEVDRPLSFMCHNRTVIEAAAQMEDRLRRKDFLVTEDELFRFFRERLPDSIYSLAGLKKHVKQHGDKNLRLTTDDVLRLQPAREEVSLFPDAIEAGSVRLPLTYRFNPDDAADGVTVRIPAHSAPDVAAERLEWLVPGLLPEKVTALLKGLPKVYRKQLVPLNRTVAVILSEMPRRDSSLIMALSDFILHRFGVDIPGNAWQPQRLPEYLNMRLALVDADGQSLSVSRDSSILKRLPAPKSQVDDLAEVRAAWEKSPIDHRDFPDLPDSIPLPGNRGDVYPGLEKSGAQVRLRIFTNRKDALAAHCAAVRQLLEKRLSREVKFVKQDVMLSPAMAGQAVYLGGAPSLSAVMAEKIMVVCFSRDIRSRGEFEKYAAGLPTTIYQMAHELKKIVTEIVKENFQTRQDLADLTASLNPRGDVGRELSLLLNELVGMLPANFVALYDPSRLEQLPRYIRAARMRARRAVDNFPAHGRKAAQVKWAIDELKRLTESLTAETSREKRRAVEDFFWLVEEYKLSIFAQEIGTAFPVSAKRVREKIREIDRMI